MRFAIAILVLNACSSIQEPFNYEAAEPEETDVAVAIAVTEWAERLDTRLDVESVPPIRWFDGCLVYENVTVNEPPCMDGRYQTSDVLADGPGAEIHLTLYPTIHESALAHELLHWALDEVAGDSDSGHRRPRWADEPEVQRIIALAGM